MGEKTQVDVVNLPPHYRYHPSGVESIEVCEGMSFCLGNAFKYVFRHRDKANKIEDLKKARWYLTRARQRGVDSESAPDRDDERIELVGKIVMSEPDLGVALMLRLISIVALRGDTTRSADDILSEAIERVSMRIEWLEAQENFNGEVHSR